MRGVKIGIIRTVRINCIAVAGKCHLPCPENYRKSAQRFCRWEILPNRPIGTVAKCAKDAENNSAPLVMVFNGARRRTLAVQAVHQNGSIDTSFDPPQFSLNSTFKWFPIIHSLVCTVHNTINVPDSLFCCRGPSAPSPHFSTSFYCLPRPSFSRYNSQKNSQLVKTTIFRSSLHNCPGKVNHTGNWAWGRK